MYRTVFAATVVLLAGQGLLVGVFAFLFCPLSIEGFAPLHEPATSVRSKIAFVVAIGAVVEAATIWIVWGLLRSTVRGFPARRTLRGALAVESILLAGSVLTESPTGAVGAGIMLALLAACSRLEAERSSRVGRPAERG